MTTLRIGAKTAAFHLAAAAVPDLVFRLREAAARIPAYSETRLLLREAAAMIEHLDRDRPGDTPSRVL